MPKFAIHLASGAVFYAILLAVFPSFFKPSLPVLAAVLLASVLPDIDHHKSRLFHLTLLIAFGVALAFFYSALQGFLQSPQREIASFILGLASALALYLLKPRHRGVTHSLIAISVYGAGVFLLLGANAIALQAAIAGATAYLIHLLLDREIKLA